MILDGPVMFDAGGNLEDYRRRRLNLEEHDDRYPSLHRLRPNELVDALRLVDLGGRGGAHFPVTRKLASLAATGAAIVVVNGAETDPWSSKDAALLQLQPHLVLDGAQALARVVHASEVVVWLQEGAAASLSAVQVALMERARDPRRMDEAPVRVLFGPRRLTTGEATAVIAGIRGLPVQPRFLPVPSRPWVEGEPVLVQNVETHARIGMLSLSGDSAYEAATLLTLTPPNQRLEVEAPATQSFGDLYASLRLTAPPHLLLGGVLGTWVAWERIARLPVDATALRRHGLSLGPGVVAEAPNGVDPLQWTADLLAQLATQGSGQCGACRLGLPDLAHRFRELVASGAGERQRRQLEELIPLVEGRGACRLPDGVVRMARSAVAVLAATKAVAA